MERPKQPGLDTRTVHGPHLGATGAMSTPIVHSATFSFESLDDMNAAQAAGSSGSFYQRNGHPTIHAVEERLAALEGAEAALLFPSGIGAIAATLTEDAETLEDVVEPFLLKEGFVTRTASGRRATARAYAHLGVPGGTPSQERLL